MRTHPFCLFLMLSVIMGSCGASAGTTSMYYQSQKEHEVILDQNKPLAEQTIQMNTAYVIRHHFDLHNGMVIMPAGCTLVFQGGLISNGTLFGTNTLVDMSSNQVIFKDMLLKGHFTSTELPLNACSSNRLECFYSFIEAFSGTNLYLTDDYSATEYGGGADGLIPASIKIDGKGHKLTLYSFGAYKVKQCHIKDITIDCRNNINPRNKWKSDRFYFGIAGNMDYSKITLENVTFTKETEFAYLRGFKNVDISGCQEDGSYFFIYDCDNVMFHGNRIENSPNAYYSIGVQTEKGHINIHGNELYNISGGGFILSGGLKHNVSIANNILENVGSGGAMKACINIHPRGDVMISGNRIVANKDAVTIDVDAAKEKYYSDNTKVTVKDNEIGVKNGDNSIHGMALVGLAKLYVSNNVIKNQRFYFWDTPYMEFINNTVRYSDGFDQSAEIGTMSTHKNTEAKKYTHYYRNNVFDIPYARGTVHFRYQTKKPIQIVGEGNTYTIPVKFVDQYNKFRVTGDIKIYK